MSCSTCGKAILEPNTTYGINPEAICKCPPKPITPPEQTGTLNTPIETSAVVPDYTYVGGKKIKKPKTISVLTPPVEAVELRERVMKILYTENVTNNTDGEVADEAIGYMLHGDKIEAILEYLQTEITKARIEELENLPVGLRCPCPRPYDNVSYKDIRKRIAQLKGQSDD